VNGIIDVVQRDGDGDEYGAGISTDLVCHVIDAGFIPWGSRIRDDTLLWYLIEGDELQPLLDHRYYIVDESGEVVTGDYHVTFFDDYNKAVAAVVDTKKTIESFHYLNR